MMGCQVKLQHLRLCDHSKKSTLSDANKRRNSSIFEEIYFTFYRMYRSSLSDSRSKGMLDKKLSIVDSIAISVFQKIIQNPALVRLTEHPKEE